jgi:hypothetical protein
LTGMFHLLSALFPSKIFLAMIKGALLCAIIFLFL